MNVNAMQKKHYGFLFIIIACLYAVKLFLILYHFHFEVADNDQALFWVACHDFSEGAFHTPFIYGTSYGSMLESLLAIPFYKSGIPLYYALPVSNGFWFFISVILLARQLDKKFTRRQTGLIFLLLFCFLDTEFYAITFAAKGHMAGIFTALIAIHLLLSNHKTYLLIIAGFLLGLALQLNPNSLFLVLASLLFVENKKAFIPLILGGIISLVYSLYTNWFLKHVDPIDLQDHLHKQWTIELSFKDFLSHLQDIDSYLSHVTPVLSMMCWVSFLIPIFALLVFLKQKNWHNAAFTSIYFLIFLFSFGVNKISDGVADELFSYSRFYLSVAFCNTILICFILQGFKPIRFHWLIYIAPIIVLINLRLTVLSANQISDHAGRWTMSVKKIFISDFKTNKNILLKKLKSTKQENPQVLVADYPLYTELLYLSTIDLKDVTIYYHCNKKFYWRRNLFDNGQNYDLLACIMFKELQELKRKEYSSNYTDEQLIPYFLFRNVRQPESQILNTLQ
jgi:hypothetical protein